jgi:hypothetical protein
MGNKSSNPKDTKSLILREEYDLYVEAGFNGDLKSFVIQYHNLPSLKKYKLKQDAIRRLLRDIDKQLHYQKYQKYRSKLIQLEESKKSQIKQDPIVITPSAPIEIEEDLPPSYEEAISSN